MDNGMHPNGGGTALASEETIRLTVAEIEAVPAPPPTPLPVGTTQRLLSLDAYRGLIMITLAANGFGLAGTALRHLKLDAAHLSLILMLTFNGFGAASAGPDLIPQHSIAWGHVRYQFDHVEWTGCGYWDLIQPSFMFMVGVAMAYSYAKRQQLGDSYLQMLRHAMTRSLLLIFLGIFLIHEWSLMNVLTQIGLGYTFLFLLWGRSLRTQAIATAAILAGTWLLYMAYPLFSSSAGIDLATGNPDVKISADWAQKHLTGIGDAWHKNANIGHAIDVWLLNLVLPLSRPFVFNNGGYQTINFIPSLATMLMGLMCGELLRSDRKAGIKLLTLVVAGLAGLAIGWALEWAGICPIVKRIWTPAWALFSTGWCCLILASLYGVIDVVGLRRWAFPLVVVGMNSIAIYCMGMILRGWARTTWHGLAPGVFAAVGPVYDPMLECILTGLLFWLACYWMYRQKIFVRI
jgi:predicted acyltransferase